jgi:hypothetical protein
VKERERERERSERERKREGGKEGKLPCNPDQFDCAF